MTIPQHHPLHLPTDIQSIDFISDLHLEPSLTKTFQAWKRYMANLQADALFILGDFFESWVGSDILSAHSPIGDFERECAEVLQQAAKKTTIYIMRGNRDFLIDQTFAEATNTILLPDPTLLIWGESRTLLTHGDLLCTDDTTYQEYRKMVHTPMWQKQVLNMPLEQRIILASQMRTQSEAAKNNNTYESMDVSSDTVLTWLQSTNTARIIHGHTHHPNTHGLPNMQERIVLSDWNLDTTEEQLRGEILRWSLHNGIKRISIQ